ncbi:hypothetical protein MKW92_018894, partial [Papaver armeniacum]
TPYAPRETSEQVYGISNRASNLEHNSISRTATVPSVTNTFRRSGETTQQEIEILNRASDVEYYATYGVAAEFNEINIVDATLAVSKVSITEEEFAGPSKKPNVESNRTWDAVSGVGEISVDNSYRLTEDKEIPFTSLHNLLSDWFVKEMDDGPISPSILKEALQGLKEVDEGSAVPKKQNPELADKQLDGTPTEMAVVTNVLNAFPADTTCETLSKQLQQIWDEVGESDGERNKMLLQINLECLDIYKRKVDQAAKSRAHLTQVSENAFWADATRETLLWRLEQIWHEVGEEDDKRHEILHHIDQECLDVYKRKVDQAAKSRSFLCRALADAKIELSMLGSALGEKTVFDKPTGTIKEQLAAIGLKLEHMSVLKEKREEEFADVKSQIRKIRGEIAGNSKLTEHAEAPTVNEDDLSLEKLDKFRSELTKFQEESDRFRFLKVRNLVDAVYDLCFELGMDFFSFINEVQPNLTLDVRSESINSGTLSKLVKAVEHLKKEKIERLEKLQDLARQLIDLWSFMDTSPEERNSFDDVIHNISATVNEVTLPETLALSLIEHAELEVERLKLKASKMKVERKISHAHTGTYPEVTGGKTMALIKTDQMIKEKVEADSSKELLGQVETWLSSCILDGGWKNIIG